jgi:nucleoside-specific outer membrane channel protein Tsx
VQVDDAGARFPVVVDPWVQQAELTASDGAAADDFGKHVAMDGSTVVVGAPQKTIGSNSTQGAAYVFVQTSGTWVQQAELTASDGAAFDEFGSSVAVSGSTIVVGAGWRTVGSNNSQGAAYVFVESNGTWSQQAELTASDGANNNYFGFSVAVSGSTVAVGAPGYPAVGSNVAQGAAYVFAESGGTWSQQAELTASDGAAYDQLGSSVAVSGSTVVAGAPCHDLCQGVAYVFVESGGTWSQQAELTASDGAAYDNFGWSVALSSSTVVVGAPHHMVGSNITQGAAYVFAESGGTWNQQAELTSSDGVAYDYFGSSVAIGGSSVVAGAPEHPYDVMLSAPGPGATYVFVESGGTWNQQAELLASDGAENDWFGYSVALSGGTAVVGSPYKSVVSNSGQGAAYVFGSSGPLYTLSASPSGLTVVQGGQGTSTITITPVNGFSGSVSFSASGLPSGVTATFNANPATSTSTLTLTASGTATTGTTTVTVIGSSGSLAQTTTLTLTVTSASSGDFTIGTSPTTVTISSPGQSGTTTITITPSGGFNETITFTGASCSGLPTGASCSFNPGSVTPNGGPASTTLTFATTAASAAIPHWPLGGRQGIFFALAVPGLLILGAGGRGKLRSGVGRTMLFVLLVGFSLVSFNGCSSGGGGGGGGGTPPGTYTITVTATPSGLSHSTTVTLAVQ